MSNFTGLVVAAAQLGLESILIKPTRGIFGIRTADGKILPDIIAQAVIEEKHHDELEITEHPVEQGAMITDHAFKRPAELTLRLGWSNSPTSRGNFVNPLIATAAANSPVALAGANLYGIGQGVQGIQSQISGAGVEQIQAIYQSLLQLQESRALFVVYTGKRVYTNMVCKMLVAETDFKSENSLPITLTCKQVILVNTQTVQLPASKQSNPKMTASSTNKGTQSVRKSLIPEADLKARIASGELKVGQ